MVRKRKSCYWCLKTAVLQFYYSLVILWKGALKLVLRHFVYISISFIHNVLGFGVFFHSSKSKQVRESRRSVASVVFVEMKDKKWFSRKHECSFTLLESSSFPFLCFFQVWLRRPLNSGESRKSDATVKFTYCISCITKMGYNLWVLFPSWNSKCFVSWDSVC